MTFFRLDDLCERIIDCPHTTPEWKEEGIRVVRNFNLNNGRLDFSKSFFVDELTYLKRVERAVPETDDIIISREAPMGTVAIVPAGLKCCLGQRLVLLKVNKTKCNPHFLLYALMSDYVQKQIKGTSGSIVSNLDIPDLKALQIPYYELSIQNQIASVLNGLNKKIESNNDINDNLTQILNLIYEQWFYRFEFPDDQNLPYKQSGGVLVYNEKLKRNIPLGWKVQTMYNNDLYSLISSGIEKFTTKKYYATADIEGTSVGDGSEIQYETRESRANMQPIINSVWFAKMKNSVKHLFLNKEMAEFIENSILSTGFYGLSCSETSFEYVSSLISAPVFEMTKDILSHGATQQGIGDDDLQNIRILIPDDVTLQKYHNATKDIFAQISVNILENKRLADIRDFLLPLLMNGQATVSE